MFLNLRTIVAVSLALTFVLVTIPIQSLFAENHAVNPEELHQALLNSAKARQTDVETVQKFFASKLVKKTLSQRMLKFSKVEKAVPLLSDEELSRLASQCRQVETDISGGALTNEQITYILIALATAVVILVIVVA